MKISALILLIVTLLFPSLFVFLKSARSQADTTPPVVSGLSVSPSDTSATVTWTTDEPADSSVDWGVAPTNDFNIHDETLVTSHSVTISNLSPSTLYYYQVLSADGANNETASNQNTFTTNAASSSSSSSSSSTTTSTTPTKKVIDTTAPGLTLSTNLSRPYIQAPTLSGSASDAGGVASVEYSTDSGANWTSASVKGEDTKSVTFSFFLGVLDDGNYNFQIRAKDSTGNVSEEKSYILIIDRLPPQVATTIFSTGPQVFSPTKEGVLVTVAGLEQKITLSAIGGPISLEIIADLKSQNSDVKSTSQISKLFKLEKNAESGLWSGNIKFDAPGFYELTTKSVDGAKNETVQSLVKVFVQEAGKVSYSGKPVKEAEISVYVFEPTLGQFILWDGASYDQSNPQKTNENGNYSFLLPAGKYYIEAKLSDFIKLRTQIFELDSPSVINTDLSASFLSVPLVANEIKIVPTKPLPADLVLPADQAGKDFPFEQVKEATGAELPRDKSQVVSFVASWLPDTSEQVKILESLPDDVKVTVIVPQESLPTVEIFKKRGKYNLDFLADPDGKLVEPLRLRFLPVHFFIDENGKIKDMRYGVLNKEEILENLQ